MIIAFQTCAPSQRPATLQNSTLIVLHMYLPVQITESDANIHVFKIYCKCLKCAKIMNLCHMISLIAVGACRYVLKP